MNSIFLRIYGGMLVVLVTVSLVSLLSIHLINDVRAEDYRERIASGTFRLMADNLQPMDTAERLRVLNLWERLMGVPLQIHSLESLQLDSSSWAQLIRGRVLVEPAKQDEVRVLALVDMADEAVLTADIQRISEQLGRATLFLIADELVRRPEADMPARLQELRREKGFGYPLQLTRRHESDLDPDQIRRLDESDTVMTLGPDGDSVMLYLKIPDTQWILHLGPLYQMSAYPPELLIIMGLLALTLIGLLIYLLVRQLEQRLMTLESVAVRISGGNLDARVDIDSQDSVGRLARAFNEMAGHVQRLMRIQRETIGAVSHELRTPVARLRFGLEMLDTAATAEDRQRFIDGMEGDLNELDRLVDEILTYARLEQGAPAITMKGTNIPRMVEHVIAELAPLDASIELEQIDNSWGLGRHVDAEPRYIQRAITNLTGNAMRHAVRKVRITTQVQHGMCRISIEDDGPGIPEAYREKIFTPFMRMDLSRTRSSGGYGLGLSIVRRIMFWHSGRARAEASQALGGACFVIEWPLRRR
ncbi:ATP-binding protein [Halopseudomonas bauzanensis]|uniref:ATP-binding protein n=1 Tax=Halopseudomonas bauzanensis TaxID=653930 RepID=UPI00255255B6|nr:ATP-binding protein [Halopseudomonas bauzanensis]